MHPDGTPCFRILMQWFQCTLRSMLPWGTGTGGFQLAGCMTWAWGGSTVAGAVKAPVGALSIICTARNSPQCQRKPRCQKEKAFSLDSYVGYLQWLPPGFLPAHSFKKFVNKFMNLSMNLLIFQGVPVYRRRRCELPLYPVSALLTMLGLSPGSLLQYFFMWLLISWYLHTWWAPGEKNLKLAHSAVGGEGKISPSVRGRTRKGLWLITVLH